MNWLASVAWHSKSKKDGERESRREDSLEDPVVFVERFSKWRDSLFVVACRVLGDSEAATQVVEQCFRKACPEPPKFGSDGAFGSWLLRVLLDEALKARAARQQAGKGTRHKLFPKLPEKLTGVSRPRNGSSKPERLRERRNGRGHGEVVGRIHAIPESHGDTIGRCVGSETVGLLSHARTRVISDQSEKRS